MIVLPDVPEVSSSTGDAEKGQINEDNLDRHVEDCLRKRDKFRRIMRGVWTFMKTRKCLYALDGLVIDFGLHSYGRKSAYDLQHRCLF